MSERDAKRRETPDEARFLLLMRRFVIAIPFVFLLILFGQALIHRAFGGALRLPGGENAGSCASVLTLTFGLNGEALRTPAALAAGARLLVLSAALLILVYAALCALFGGTLGSFFGFAVACAVMAAFGWGLAAVRRKFEA